MVLKSAIFLAFLAPATCLVGRLVAQRAPTQPHRRFATQHSPTQRRAATDDYVGDDYLITDSLDLRERPSLATALTNPRDLLALALLAVGAAVSAENVAGSYGSTYVATEVAAVALGAASAAATPAGRSRTSSSRSSASARISSAAAATPSPPTPGSPPSRATPPRASPRASPSELRPVGTFDAKALRAYK